MRTIAVNARFLRDRVTGVQRYAVEMCRVLAPRLARDGFGLVLLAPAGPLQRRIESARVVQSRSRLHVLAWEQLLLPRMVNSVKADLLWSPANAGPLAVARQVVTIHDASVFVHPEWFDRRFALFYRALLPRLARRVARVVTDSESSARDLVEHGVVEPRKLAVVPSGVGFGGSEAAVPRTAPLPEPYLLTVASLEPRKNLRTLLAAWERLQAGGALPHHRLVIAGAASRVFSGSGLDGQLPPRVISLGYISDGELQRYYAHADAFVYPSLYEGFGLPPLEAMLHGRPVLVSDIPSLKEVCGPDALFVNPMSAEELAEGMLRIATDAAVRARLSRSGPERARSFGWERAAAALEEVFREAMAG